MYEVHRDQINSFRVLWGEGHEESHHGLDWMIFTEDGSDMLLCDLIAAKAFDALDISFG